MATLCTRIQLYLFYGVHWYDDEPYASHIRYVLRSAYHSHHPCSRQTPAPRSSSIDGWTLSMSMCVLKLTLYSIHVEKFNRCVVFSNASTCSVCVCFSNPANAHLFSIRGSTLSLLLLIYSSSTSYLSTPLSSAPVFPFPLSLSSPCARLCALWPSLSSPSPRLGTLQSDEGRCGPRCKPFGGKPFLHCV